MSVHNVKIEMGVLHPELRVEILSGEYERSERELCQAHLTPDDGVVELGANIGFLGLFCQINLGVAAYTSVEPNPGTVNVLRRNYEANGRRPDVMTLAVSNRRGQVRLGVSEFSCTDSLIARGSRFIVVEAQPLDEILSRVKHRVTCLIIDVEGAELLVDFAVVPEEVAKVIIEIHEELIGLDGVQEVLARLLKGGFRCRARLGSSYYLSRGAGRGLQ